MWTINLSRKRLESTAAHRCRVMSTGPAADDSGLRADKARGDVVDKALELFGRGGGRWAKDQTVHPDVGVAPDGVQIDAAAAWRRDADLKLAKVLGPSQL